MRIEALDQLISWSPQYKVLRTLLSVKCTSARPTVLAPKAHPVKLLYRKLVV
jgi:hypothetical protein